MAAGLEVVDPRAAWRHVQAAHRAVTGSAGELVGALVGLVETEAWRAYEHPRHGLRTYERFADFLENELSLTPPAVLVLLRESNRKTSAARVERLLREDITPAGGVSVTHPQDKRDAGAIVARLKRDDPDLAAQVVAGDITPNAAAVRAGIRHQYARVRTDDPRRAVAVLLKHYTREQLLVALEVP